MEWAGVEWSGVEWAGDAHEINALDICTCVIQ